MHGNDKCLIPFINGTGGLMLRSYLHTIIVILFLTLRYLGINNIVRLIGHIYFKTMVYPTIKCVQRSIITDCAVSSRPLLPSLCPLNRSRTRQLQILGTSWSNHDKKIDANQINNITCRNCMEKKVLILYMRWHSMVERIRGVFEHTWNNEPTSNRWKYLSA